MVHLCSNAIEAYNILQREKVDLLFADIQMPQLSGMELVRNLLSNPKIIITTAYREYALDGYVMNARDYLLKPISFDCFLIAMSKLFPLKDTGIENDSLPLANGAIDEVKDAFVYLKSDKKISEFEEKLPNEQFLRVHRSFLVSLNHIDAYTATQLEIGGKFIPIGRIFKNEVLRALKDISTLDF
ncbi:MAG: LytR/AlgR family response regulator transcription factor [Marinifilaceae bacterium]